jgi:hypothetical protein
MEKLLFKEEQRFSQWRLGFVLLLSFSAFIPFLYGVYSQEILNKPYGENPMSISGLIITGSFFVLIMTLVFYFFTQARLKTRITYDGIGIAFPPIMKKWKNYAPKEIEKYEVRLYKPFREFGGHGMKGKKRKFGQSYTMSGKVGLQLYLKNGRKILVGTQRKQAIEYAMEKMMKSENSKENG